MQEKIFTTEQVANILQVHPFTVLKFIKEGKLTGIKLGRVYRIKESEVEKFLEERMTEAKARPEVPKEQKKVEKENVRLEPADKDEPEQDHYYII